MGATVSIHQGKLEGDDQGGLSVFKGIPFAAPPVGTRRWLAPEKPASWSGVRDARRFGAVNHQNKLMLSALSAFVIDGEQSEDCLTLNVWTPALDGKRRPVMVWIHGGAFTIGSGSQALYDGSVLARRGDTVVVTINYRLGPLGFLRLADVTNGKIPSSGSEGMLDQVAALRMGPRQHRRVRRRPRQRHHLRRIGRRHERRNAARDARGARPVPQSDTAKRRQPYRRPPSRAPTTRQSECCRDFARRRETPPRSAR